MDFLPEKIENYVSEHTSEESQLLSELNRETWQKILAPVMISGHVQGRFLSMMSQMIQPKYVLEIGTYTGYSALCFCEGMQSDGELHTIDINEELKEIQDKYFAKSKFRNLIHQHIGNALDLVPSLEKEWDLVFIDADKANYLNYYELVLPKLRPGGFIILDNVLWYGKVCEPIDPNDKDTVGIHELNSKVQSDSRVENVLLPLRDGLMVLRKV